ncbi:MAG: thiamine phosphate synthase, partial [Burkholderiales bacterium]
MSVDSPEATLRPRIAGLYAITPDGLATGALLERVAAALQGGARVLQYRDKSSDAARRREQA